jgi:hypothetical protein
VGLRGLPVPHVPEVRMSGWKITLHEKRPENPQVGDMWPAPWLRREEPPQPCFFLSPRYVREHAHRPPLVVRLPGPVDFCVDQPEWDANARLRGPDLPERDAVKLLVVLFLSAVVLVSCASLAVAWLAWRPQ